MNTLPGLSVVTSGTPIEVGEALIDHLALTPTLKTSPLRFLPARSEDDQPLSVHVGYSLDISGSEV